MFAPTSNLILPSSTLQPLWRYLSADRLGSLLSSEQLFFSHLPRFEDGYEGALTEKTRERLFRWSYERYRNAATAHGEVEQYESHREAFYVNCWHMNNAESYLMWKAYGDRGFAIQTTFERAIAAFDSFKGAVTGGVVEYLDYEREETRIGNVFTHVVTKDLPFRDEREFRFLIWKCDPKNCQVDFAQKGVGVAINARMLIERVVVHPLVKELPPTLQSLLDSMEIPYVVGPSRIRLKNPGGEDLTKLMP